MYQALCILVIHLARQVSPLPILQMAFLRSRDIKILDPLCSNLQAWESGLFASKTGHISLPPFTASPHGRSGESRSSRQWWDLQLNQIAQEKQHRKGERGWLQESMLNSWK